MTTVNDKVALEAGNHLDRGIAEAQIHLARHAACRLVMPLLVMELSNVIGLGFYDEELASLDDQRRIFFEGDPPGVIAEKTRAKARLPGKLDIMLRDFNAAFENRLDWCFEGISYRQSFGTNAPALSRIVSHISELTKTLASARNDQAAYTIWERFRKRYINELNPTSSGWIPPEVVHLCTQLLDADYFHAIHDPFAGAGTLLTDAASHARERPSWAEESVYTGHEANRELASLACLSTAFLPKAPDACITNRDALFEPCLEPQTGQLQQYPNIISNLSFGHPQELHLEELKDVHNRFKSGIPSSNCPDLARLLHVISILADNVAGDQKTPGRAVCLIRPAALERSGGDAIIRGKIIEQNLIEAVIRLPRKVVPGVSAGACILILTTEKHSDEIIFVDATSDYKAGRSYNELTERGIKSIQKSILGAREGWPLLDDTLVATVSARDVLVHGANLSVTKYVESKARASIKAVSDNSIQASGVSETLSQLSESISSFDHSLTKIEKILEQ